jgi:malonyl-CoA/methylmalonyl-CoA synthetase
MAGANLLHALYDHRPADSVVLHVPGGESLTTADMLDKIGRTAAVLAEQGVAPGDRVSFRLEKSPAVVVLAHACLQLGAILHPLNTAYTDEEVAFLLNDAAPRLLFCDPVEEYRLSAVVAGTGIQLASLSGEGQTQFEAQVARSKPLGSIAQVDPNTTAAVLYTSGTTGQPKGARITHRNLSESARALAEVWKLGRKDTLLHALPVYHAHGLLTSINTMLVAGGSVQFLPHFETREVLAALRGATLMMGVPTHYSRLLREPDFAAALPDTFKLVISGSAPLPLELASQFFSRTGRQIVERYGSTEAAIITAIPAGTIDRTGWVGWPLPGIDVRVARDDGTRAAHSAIGVLETRGHNVFAGYWNRPDADRDAFTPDGWFITGDIAEIDDTGCVRLLGRSKDLIISGGLNVYPKEVETVLDSLPGIAESAVFGVPHPDFGEAVMAAVKLGTNAAFDELAAIKALRAKLAAYKTPKRILAVTAIPRNKMGKVLKNELRREFGSFFAAPAAQERLTDQTRGAYRWN